MATGHTAVKSHQVAIAAGVATFAVGAGAWWWHRRRIQESLVAIKSGDHQRMTLLGGTNRSSSSCGCGKKASNRGLYVRILYGSTTGTSKRWAEYVAKELQCIGSVEIVVEDLATFAFDTLLARAKPQSGCCSEEAPYEATVVLLSTEAGGTAPPSCEHFLRLLEDHAYDFRVGAAALIHLGFAVIGFGSKEYEPLGHYCTAASKVDELFAKLSASRLVPLRKVTDTEEHAAQVEPWTVDLMRSIQLARDGVGLSKKTDADAEACCGGGGGDVNAEDIYETSTEASEAPPDPEAEDLEELAEGCAGQDANPQEARGPPEMLTKKHKAQLQKEGYKLVGSHSAVKLCRWTKHQLRGRGGCYKHSFYNITSYQCMEATPSLACANKCVFCWRHHKNPVGTSWKWRMDPPEDIVSEGIDQHRRMIRECKGIPGVKKERFEDAMTVRHCALSLVGEPIMYPRINEMLQDLHRRHISTFLVTNAQFPEAIHALTPITQLYVSVDAATPEALKAVDRPLFGDFWDRHLESLRAIKLKKQRTVYRLTLMKGHNMASAADYARLVALGEPDFIEIKSVTFCGESKASNLKLADVPWHEEVKAFCEAILAEEGLEEHYELACEHQHSCIVLLANKRFKIDGQWHTWIDYERFDKLVNSGDDFDAMDYVAPTPSWALYGSTEAGFDPKETRVYHNRTVKRAKAGLLSDAQLRQYPTNPAQA